MKPQTKTRLLHSTAIVLVTTFITALGALNVCAQDAHYWDNQYGTKAELLGGLVVGAPTDLSSTFYNPGWLALQEKSSVLLTTKAAEIYRFEFKNSSGESLDPSNTVIAPSPGYLAGRFSLSNDLGWQWAYTFLQKVDFEYATSQISDHQNPEALPPAGTKWSSRESFREVELAEDWYGISLSRKLADHLAIGFSPYLVYRSHDSRTQATIQTLNALDDYAGANLVDDYDYWHARFLVKMGLGVEWEKWSAGLTVTTPSLGLSGEGAVYVNTSLSGDYDASQPGVDAPFLETSHQEGISAKWKSPLSIAGGAAVNLGPTRIHLTAEWFNSISRYSVLTPEPFAVQSIPGQTRQIDLDHAADSVFNIGLGVNHDLTPSLSLFSSYRTDFSTIPDDMENQLNIAVWNLNHITGGAAFQLMGIELTTGIQFSWGDNDASRTFSFDVTDAGDLAGEVQDNEVSYRRLKVLLGFNLPFVIPEG